MSPPALDHMESLDKHSRIGLYADRYRDTDQFEQVLVDARQLFLVELISDLKPASVVEIGCGPRPLFRRVLTDPVASAPVRRWVTVEPAADFAASAVDHSLDLPQVSVVPGFAEESVARVRDLVGPADLVICASLLHEVPDPADMLAALRAMGGPGSVLHVNVPNALSLHRRLARAMGLIGDEHDLSGRNRLLDQPRVFDLGRLRHEMSEAGFAVTGAGGLFIKPFTHDQMERIPFLTPALLDGLARLGRELPDLAAEIWVNARWAPE